MEDNWYSYIKSIWKNDANDIFYSLIINLSVDHIKNALADFIRFFYCVSKANKKIHSEKKE